VEFDKDKQRARKDPELFEKYIKGVRKYMRGRDQMDCGAATRTVDKVR
jgi:hypothetical protein